MTARHVGGEALNPTAAEPNFNAVILTATAAGTTFGLSGPPRHGIRLGPPVRQPGLQFRPGDWGLAGEFAILRAEMWLLPQFFVQHFKNLLFQAWES